jgi:hypothetical protein
MTQDASPAMDAKQFAALNGYVLVGPTFSLRNDANIFEQALDAAAPIGELAMDCVSFVIGFGDGSAAVAVARNDKIVRVTPPPAGAGTPVVFYQYAPGDWRRVANQQYVDNRALFVVPSFFSYYQVFAAAAELPFGFGDVYVFPNPTGVGETPTLHIEVGLAEKLSTRIYDVSGDLAYETRVDEAPLVANNGSVSYEIKLPADRFKSGVYVGIVTAERAGRQTIRRQYRFTVVK